MNAKAILGGVWAPVTTPFTGEQALDLHGLEKNMQVYAASGLQGYLALGSNGENKSLSFAEKRVVLRHIVKNKAVGQKVMAGCIAESTLETIELAKMAEAEGADFITLLSPSYFAKQMTDEVLERYFTEVADSVAIPALVYCAPQYSGGVVLSRRLIRAVARHPGIVGMKDSSTGNIDGYVAESPEDFAVMSGSASIFLHTMELGGAGGILSLANAFPDFCVRLHQLYVQKGNDACREMNDRLLRLNKGISGLGGVAAVKAAMDMAGLAGGDPRRPLLPLDMAARAGIKALLQAEGLL